MSQKSLGLIETYGLLAAVEAADAAVKSANVTLVGYEFAKGSGMTTIKVEGDVGAVKAAISAAQVAASKVGRVASTRVIPRPSQYLEGLVRNKDTVGYELPAEPEPEPDPPAPPKGPARKQGGRKPGKSAGKSSAKAPQPKPAEEAPPAPVTDQPEPAAPAPEEGAE